MIVVAGLLFASVGYCVDKVAGTEVVRDAALEVAESVLDVGGDLK